jgi:UTP--glucose-1-phosphate uridylyltransferase
MKKITKAVFPVAGLGTRFLPVTKASPKEMLPVVDKPLIQYAVEEAAAAGITDMIFITGRNKRAIEDHFDKAYELETELQLRNKASLLEQVQAATPYGINCVYIRQTEALGLGHAVLCAEPVVADEPFAVLLADDLIDAPIPVMKQMVDLATRENASAIGVMNVAPDETSSYGIVEAEREPVDERVGRITRIVEKPKPGTSTSTLAVVGRYVLSPRIFHHLRTMPAGAGGEIQLTDAIGLLLMREPVHAVVLSAKRYDIGSPIDWLKTNLAFAARDAKVWKQIASLARELLDGADSDGGGDNPRA